MKVEKIVTEVNELDITGATLLSKEEYEKYEGLIPLHDTVWWLRSPDPHDGSYSGDVDDVGYVSYDIVDYYGGVVPALQIHNLESSNLQIGDKFKLADHTFTVISEKYALCDNIIGKCPFRRDWEVKDANDYEASDVKKYVDGWFDGIKESEIYDTRT